MKELNFTTTSLVIAVMSLISLILRLVYYTIMHIWSNVIIVGKKLIRKDFEETKHDLEELRPVQQRFFKYVFISRNTWILGKLKHVEITLMVLPKEIIDCIKNLGGDLEHNFNDANKNSPLAFIKSKNFVKFLISFFCFPFVILLIVINLAVIILFIAVLILAIPLAILVYLYNLRSVFKVIDLEDDPMTGLDDMTEELPPDVNCDKKYAGMTLTDIEADLKLNGTINRSNMAGVTKDEWKEFALVLLWLKRKSQPLKYLILDNCSITDDKMKALKPLILKFDHVSLNGGQRLTNEGWSILAEGILSPGTRLRKLQMKITKTEELKVRKEMFLDEFRESMSPESLIQVGRFLPYLEKVYLDDVFNEHIFAEMILVSSDKDKLTNAWKSLAKSIETCPTQEFKLKRLSLAGCAINDDILKFLGGAIKRIKEVHLGRNAITHQGWKSLLMALEEEGPLVMTKLTIAMGMSPQGKHIKPHDMYPLSQIMLMMEEVDLSGQHEIGEEGWLKFAEVVQVEVSKKDSCIKLKVMNLSGCRIKESTKQDILDAWNKFAKSDKLNFGPESFDEQDSKIRCFPRGFKCCCCT